MLLTFSDELEMIGLSFYMSFRHLNPAKAEFMPQGGDS